MRNYKEYMLSVKDDIVMYTTMEDEEYLIKLIESVMESFGVLPEQVIRQVMLLTGMFD